jgi:hypothetical protein
MHFPLSTLAQRVRGDVLSRSGLAATDSQHVPLLAELLRVGAAVALKFLSLTFVAKGVV